jgi:hypothetical protein
MNQTPTFRDVEQISAYLDGQLSEAETRRLSARLQIDPELASVTEALRQSRALLRQTPRRRAPRNFTLTPKMAGVKPPLPRAVPVMRLASVFAAFLLFVSFTVNAISVLPAAAPMAYGIGGGAAEDAAPEPAMMESAAEAPVEPEAPPEAPELRQPASSPEPTATMLAPAPEEPAQPKTAPDAPDQYLPPEPPIRTAPVTRGWQAGLAGLAVLLGASAFLLARFNEARWRRKK